MDITLKVKKVTLLVKSAGTDEIDLMLDEPSPFPETGYEGHFTLHARRGHGLDWCRTVLGVEPEVIDAS